MNALTPKLLLHPVHLLSLGFGAGYAPRAPGTAGTLVGVLVCLPVQYLPWTYQLALVAVLYAAGVWLCARTAAALGVHDHPGIVFDEIVGFLAAMIAAPRGWGWILLGFVCFRLFDIFKPWPISLLDRGLKGGNGIMADDLLAGLFSLTVIQIIAYIL